MSVFDKTATLSELQSTQIRSRRGRQHANSLNKHKLLSVSSLKLGATEFWPSQDPGRDLQITATERNVRSKWTDQTSPLFPSTLQLSVSSLRATLSDSISAPSLSWPTFCQFTAPLGIRRVHGQDFSPIAHSSRLS